MLLGLNKKRQACRGHFDEPTKVYGAVNTYSTPSICWIQRCLPRNGNLMRCTSQTVSSPLIYGAKKKKEKKEKRKRAGEKSWKTAGNLLQPNTTWLGWSPLASASWSWSVLRLITLHSLIPLSCFLLASPPRPFSFLSFFFFFFGESGFNSDWGQPESALMILPPPLPPSPASVPIFRRVTLLNK